MSIIKTLRKLYPGRVLTPKNAAAIPTKQYLVYVLECDGRAIVVGHGKQVRARVIFDSISHITSVHFKAIFVRLHHLFAGKKPRFGRYIITCASKSEALGVEKSLHHAIGGNKREIPEAIRKKLFKGIPSRSTPWMLLQMALSSSYDGLNDLFRWRKLGIIGDADWKVVSRRLKLHVSAGKGLKGKNKPASKIPDSLSVQSLAKHAAQGNGVALGALQRYLVDGNGTPDERKEAVNAFFKAAKKGNAEAQFFAGIACCTGDGVPKDTSEAAILFGKAASQGHPEAQFLLGTMFARGEGVKRDLDEATRWYLMAADQGHADAHYYLGLSSHTGYGKEKDVVAGYAWVSAAASLGSTKAKDKLPILERELSAEQVDTAKNLAKERIAGLGK